VIDTIHSLPIMLSITLGVDSEDLERHLAASPRVVGAELALQVDDYANRNRLGYYPALAYFKEQGGVEPDLLKAEDDIAWFLTNWAQEQVQRLLRPQFAQIRFELIQATAFTMPSARPQSRDGVKDLARHYTVDQIKILLEATTVGKLARGNPQDVADAGADKARKALQRRFPLLQLNSVALQ
jgi:hypothetical protein